MLLSLSMQTLRHIQTDYEKRLKDVETQKEQLLDEMESRETTLINKVITILFTRMMHCDKNITANTP